MEHYNPGHMNYFNTTDLKGADLEQAKTDARAQDDKILSFMLSNSHRGWTPWEVLEHCHALAPKGEEPLITSVRRSMNTLTRKGFIVKSDQQKVSDRTGRPEHIWFTGPQACLMDITVSDNDVIRELEREIKMREQYYPQWIASGKREYTVRLARERISCLRRALKMIQGATAQQTELF